MRSGFRGALGPDGWVRVAFNDRPMLESAREREIAGRIGGGLYTLGGVLAIALAVFASDRPLVMGAVAATAIALGVVMLVVVPWRRVPPWVFVALTVVAVALTTAATALTNGVDSPSLLIGAVMVTFACSFFSARAALGIVLLVSVVTLLPLTYDDETSPGNVTELLMAVPVQIGLGIFVLVGATRVRELAASQRRLAREQAALLDLAKDVASDRETDDEVFARAAKDAARLLGADGGALMRFEGRDEAVLVAEWTDGIPGLPVGTIVPAGQGSPLGEVRRTGRALHHVMSRRPEVEGVAAELPFDETAMAPVRAGGRLWGVISVAVGHGRTLGPDAVEKVAAFADLISTAVVNRQTRQQLVDQATRDPLTGLYNHRAFHERLRTELARAQRYGRELALVVLDVDHFKSINDAAGHDIGDRVLANVAARLREAARTEDTIARIGGDEFAMLLPETDGVRAYAAMERTRSMIGASPVLPGISVTISAGICDLRNAQDADSMFRLADGALYWSKAHGRDATWIYDPEVVRELSAAERAEQLRRSQALLGIRALARAIDAKDPSTSRHSERVAALSRRLAEALEWEPARVALLEEAALVHDVGKIGVPDAVLLKPGRLTTGERRLVGKHADLGARIVEDVLTEEQVEWIRSHHERPDGQGYPRGLTGADISMGAAILTVADSFDVMTMSRPYSAAKPPDAAVAECEGLVGRQFVAAPVEALVALHVSGELTVLMAGGKDADEVDPLGPESAELPPPA